MIADDHLDITRGWKVSYLVMPMIPRSKENIENLPNPDEVKDAKSRTHSRLNEIAREKHDNLLSKQHHKMTRNLEQLSAPGASSWVGAIPLKEPLPTTRTGKIVKTLR